MLDNYLIVCLMALLTIWATAGMFWYTKKTDANGRAAFNVWIILRAGPVVWFAVICYFVAYSLFWAYRKLRAK